MTEIIFTVEESPEGGYQAKALSHSIFTEAEDLKQNIREAINRHFEEVDKPKMVRLHMVKEEVEVFAACSSPKSFWESTN